MVRVGAGSSPAFQRLSRDTWFFILSAWLAEMVSRHPRLVPRYGPPRVRAPGPQMILVAPGTSGWQTRGVASLTLLWFVTDSEGVPDDVRGLGGGGGYVAYQTLVEEQHHTIAGAMMWALSRSCRGPVAVCVCAPSGRAPAALPQQPPRPAKPQPPPFGTHMTNSRAICLYLAHFGYTSFSKSPATFPGKASYLAPDGSEFF
eukprot:gene11520-biopygen10917